MNISIINKIGSFENDNIYDSFNILLTGDFCPDRKVGDLIRLRKYNNLFNDFLPFVKNADISVTNLECPLAERDEPIDKAGPVLIGLPEAAHALKYAGFNLVCLANNHIYDHGESGLDNTINALDKQKIRHIGAGRNLKEATLLYISEIKGYKIAFINITEHESSIATENRGGAAPIDEIINYSQVMRAKEIADFVILVIHGGHEMYPLPSPRMKKLYHFYADIGVNAVIGHHAHVFSGYEIYKGVPIFYSLGNFLFERKLSDAAWYKGFAVNLRIQDNCISGIYIIPYKQFYNCDGVQVLNELELYDFRKKIIEYNKIIADENKLQKRFQEFARKQRVYYLSTILGLNKYQKKLLKMGLYKRYFIKRNKLLARLNHIRCQAHKDLLIEVLSNECML